jgi:hypothetical protein
MNTCSAARSQDPCLGIIEIEHVSEMLRSNHFYPLRLQPPQHLLKNETNTAGSTMVKSTPRHLAQDDEVERDDREVNEVSRHVQQQQQQQQLQHEQQQQKEKEKYLANKKIASHLFRKPPPAPLAIPYLKNNKNPPPASSTTTSTISGGGSGGNSHELAIRGEESSSPLALMEQQEEEENELEQYPVEQSVNVTQGNRSAKQTAHSRQQHQQQQQPPVYIIPKRERTNAKQSTRRGSSSVLARASSERKTFLSRPSTQQPSPPPSPTPHRAPPPPPSTSSDHHQASSSSSSLQQQHGQFEEAEQRHGVTWLDDAQVEAAERSQVQHAISFTTSDLHQQPQQQQQQQQTHVKQVPHHTSAMMPDVSELRMEALKKAEKKFELAKETNKKDYTLLKTLKNKVEINTQNLYNLLSYPPPPPHFLQT